MTLTHLDEEPCTTVSVRHAAASVPQTRRLMVEELLEFGLDRAVISDAEIVLSVLVTNAIEHGSPLHETGFDVTWCVTAGTIRIIVRDGGTTRVLRALPPEGHSLRGRGLHMVATICDRWQADLYDGTQVTAEMSI